MYPSVQPTRIQPPELGLTEDGVVTAPALCTFAQEVARTISALMRGAAGP